MAEKSGSGYDNEGLMHQRIRNAVNEQPEAKGLELVNLHIFMATFIKY